MGSFTKINLTGERVLVRGQDSTGRDGETVLDGSEWAEVNRRLSLKTATVQFDEAVEQFFAPLMEAVEKLEAAGIKQDTDPMSYVVLEEGNEGEASTERVVHHLSKDSIVLRLLENGGDDRLVWVGDTLEILEVLPGTSTAGVEDHGFDSVSQV